MIATLHRGLTLSRTSTSTCISVPVRINPSILKASSCSHSPCNPFSFSNSQSQFSSTSTSTDRTQSNSDPTNPAKPTRKRRSRAEMQELRDKGLIPPLKSKSSSTSTLNQSPRRKSSSKSRSGPSEPTPEPEPESESQPRVRTRAKRRSRAEMAQLREAGVAPDRRGTATDAYASKYSSPKHASQEIGRKLQELRNQEDALAEFKREKLSQRRAAGGGGSSAGEETKRSKEKGKEKQKQNRNQEAADVDEYDEGAEEEGEEGYREEIEGETYSSKQLRRHDYRKLLRELRKSHSQVALSELDETTLSYFQSYLSDGEEKYQSDFHLLEAGELDSIDSPKSPPLIPSEELNQNDWLPHPACWRYTFSKSNKIDFLSSHRYFLLNQKAKELVESLQLERKDGKKWTVVEAYPGPGILTKQFLQSPHVEKVISMEELPIFKPWLQKLKQDPTLCPRSNPNRLEIIEESGYRWEAYNEIIQKGYLDHLSDGKIKDEDGEDLNVRNVFENPRLKGAEFDSESSILFIAQLPNTVHSEQLYAQLIHAISSRTWLFRYGRIRMVFVSGDHLAARSIAEPGEKMFRGKLSASVQALSEVRVLQKPSELLPHHHHFYPSHPSVGLRLPLTSPAIPTERVAGATSRYPMAVIQVTPKKGKDQIIRASDLEAFEYITRNLFILKAKSVEEALKHTAPGAVNVLKKLQPGDPKVFERGEVPVDAKARIVDLEVNQLASLARVFEKWPFRPENLFEEGRIRNEHRGKRTVPRFS